MTKSTITRERLQEIAEDGFLKHGESKELARIALAAMDSEPYGFTDGDRRGMIYKPEHSDRLSEPVPVYRHAQPAPVVPETAHSSVIAEQLAHVLSGLKVTDHQRAVISCAVDRLNNVAQLLQLSPSALLVPEILDYQGAKELYNYLMTEEEINATVNAWNACRAAMLAAATQSPGSEPATVPGKWIPVSERMPEDRSQVILWDAEIGEVTSGHYSHKTHTFYHCGDAIENEITHWMAPPAAPQEVSDA
ncbi:DUF551 domain-containing protein [Klebsiella pneumoniae]